MIAAFGTRANGTEVRCITLRGHGQEARVLTLGAILSDLRLRGRPLTLGSPELAAYDEGAMRHFGAVIGPVANRIAGARGVIDGVPVRMEANEGTTALHSGAAGLGAKVWDIAAHGDDHVTLEVEAKAGEGGLPGNRRFSARYALEAGGVLRFTLSAQTDAATWINLTQHSYWHLGGAAGIDGHVLSVDADRYLPTADGGALPTGVVAPVGGTPFDLREPRVITPDLRLDHNFCLADAPRALCPVARLVAPDGLSMVMETTAPGLQLFTADPISLPTGHTHDGAARAGRLALALEPQHWPDAPNNPDFPDIVLRRGETWQSDTRLTFHAP